MQTMLDMSTLSLIDSTCISVVAMPKFCLAVSKRYKFLSHDLRRNLFSLFNRWSGQFGLSQKTEEKRSVQE